MSSLTLHLLAEELVVCRGEPDAPLPSGLWTLPFVAVVRSAEEMSLVVPVGHAPAGWRTVGPWRAFKVAGPLDFALVGILAGLSGALADAAISVFAVSTFDTDYLLVRAADADGAAAAWRAAGHRVIL